jgi:hypothetical protein
MTPTTTTTTTTKTGPAAQRAEPMANTRRRRRNNKPYTFEQEAFLIYHRVDLHLTWGEVRAAFLARWPHLERTVGGLECIYYRTNAVLPATTPDGLLVLVDPTVEAGAGAGVGAGAGEYGFGDEGKVGYKYYRGVAYRTLQVKCRAGEISLMERFPEELVEEGNEWVRAEHRTGAMRLGELFFSVLTLSPHLVVISEMGLLTDEGYSPEATPTERGVACFQDQRALCDDASPLSFLLSLTVSPFPFLACQFSLTLFIHTPFHDPSSQGHDSRQAV